MLTALAMGARVIGVGRTQSKLDALASSLANASGERLSQVALTEDVEKDTTRLREVAGGAGADCYVDFSKFYSRIACSGTKVLTRLYRPPSCRHI